MAYATVDDVQSRISRTLDNAERTMCGTLLDDAALIIDTFNQFADDDAKKLVSCNMVIRSIGDGQQYVPGPIGATQGTVSALGYSQSWTMSSGGSVGELYLTKIDKRLLGVLGRITYVSPFEEGGTC